MTRLLAALTGLLGFLCALAVPFLPVSQTTAQMTWPQSGTLTPVTAPLVTYAPTALDIAIPCSAAADLQRQGGRVLVSTAPTGTTGAIQRALVIAESFGEVTVRSAGTLLARAQLSDVAAGRCDTITVTSTGELTTAAFTGLVDPSAHFTITEDVRPQVVGMFTDLTGPPPDGMTVHATIDTRYEAAPTLAKWLAMGFAIALTLLSLASLSRLDAAARGTARTRSLLRSGGGIRGPDGRPHPGGEPRSRGLGRLLPRRWRYFGPADATVLIVLLVWHIIGANTSDDGYELAMARVAEHAGYMPNYFRWYGAPEAPFGYPYYIFTLLSHVSASSVVLRLPALVAAIVTWLVVSREIVPRFGRAARRGSPALWTAALMLLAFWLPYNNGLRPEPYIAAGIVITWVCVERSVATGRLLPTGLALVVAGLTLTGGPTGTICAAPFLAAARPLLRLVRRHARRFGYAAVVAPLLASATLVVVVAFSRASLGPLVQATRMKPVVGPSEPWYLEFQRYTRLLQASPDGSIARRFAVLAMLLCLAVCAVLLLRRRAGLIGSVRADAASRWRIHGLAAGPAQRAVLIVLLGMVLMTFNPTKWTHHFGVFAGLAAALGALAVVAVQGALRGGPAAHPRGRALYTAGVLLVLAATFTSINSWWYVSNYGVPNGLWVTWAGWVFAAVCLILGLKRLRWVWRTREGGPAARADEHAPDEQAPDDEQRPAAPRIPAAAPSRLRWGPAVRASNAARTRLAGLPTYAPLPIAAAGVVAFSVISLAVAIVAQYPAYSVGLANARALAGHPCNLSDDVLVETDPTADLLEPVGIAPGQDPLAAGGAHGFSPNGIPADVSYRHDSLAGLVGNPTVAPDVNPPGTGGGVLAQPGVNGSFAALPFGLDPARTPVLGSFNPGDPEAVADAVSAWYALPPRSADRPVLTLAAAGEVKRENMSVEFGRAVAGGFEVLGDHELYDVGPAPSWRDMRVPFSEIPDDAQAVRIVAHDDEEDEDDWIAFTPPRVPRVQTMQQLLGSDDPVFMDWPVPLITTCQRLPDYLDGVAEEPGYRIRAESGLAVVATNWQSAQGGGPLGRTELLQRAVTLPTYLDHDWKRQWGDLVRYDPRVPDAVPARIDTGTAERSGLWTPGPIKAVWTN